VSASSLITLVSALALILGLVALLSRFVRRLSGAHGSDRLGRIEVLGRASLAPRQGVATIRVEDRVLLVSFGDGGVRQIADLGSSWSQQPTLCEEPATRTDASTGPPAMISVLRTRVGGLRAFMLSLVLLFGLSADAVVAQTASDSLAANTVAAVASQVLSSPNAPNVDLQVGGGDDGLRVSGTVGTVLFIGFMTMIPTLLLLTTSFTRILIVLHLLKQAIGTQTAPPAHLLTAMALLLTGFVMAPTFDAVHTSAVAPWLDGEIDEVQMIQTAAGPMREFMLGVTREQDLAAFLEMRDTPAPETIDDVPFVVVTSAFVTSELTHAFQIGFALFLPFVIIDLVVAAVLMSMGMFMLPPAMISLPFKLLLFVLVDGWALVMGSLVQSF
jgi:flagellar biosynthetic protein FliP